VPASLDLSSVSASADEVVALRDGTLLAVGWRNAGGADDDLAWTTRDGLSWSAVALPTTPYAGQPIAAGPDLLYVGSEPTQTETVPVVYLGTPSR
jgi:hypothetical protein